MFHVDGVQAFGKIPLKLKKLGVDLFSASSHKIHGPKGAGILYVRKGARILPLHYGGEQEKKHSEKPHSLKLRSPAANSVTQHSITAQR